MKSYDLNLSQWGPYSKQYLGGCHIADKKNGIGFNFTLFPGFYRRNLMVADSICDNGVKIIDSSEDCSRFLYKYQLMGKDDVYMTAEFVGEGKKLKVICDFVNNTDENQSVVLNCCGYLDFASYYSQTLYTTVKSGEGIFIASTDYKKIISKDSFAIDGLHLGEVRKSGFYRGSAINLAILEKDGYVEYSKDAVADKVFVKLKAKEGQEIRLEINGKAYKFKTNSEDVSNYKIEIPKEKIESVKIFNTEEEALLDGIIIGDNTIVFEPINKKAKVQATEGENNLILDYGLCSYKIEWDYSRYVVRKLKTSDMGRILSHNIHDHVSKLLDDGGIKEFDNLFLNPIFLKPRSKKRINISVSALHKEDKPTKKSKKFLELSCNTDGEKYLHSQKIMKAVTLTNVVFPLYCRGEYICHNTPGRLWDSLYTWDSGFIGMGLNAISTKRSEECLNTYLTPKGDMHSPFIFHGSVVPTQVFLYAQIFEKTADIGFLEKYYDSMEQYHSFFKTLPTVKGLPKTWDIFYNSGGWDDYPAQKYVWDNNLTDSVSPVITASMIIICAKILKNFAEVLKRETKTYEADIEHYKALLMNLYDEESGYFGYATDSGDILRIDGVNANMGFDGIYPFIAGVTDKHQSEKIVSNIKNGLLTRYGVSVVDTRAPYFDKGGYWNGSIWMPHQWILFKSCLDTGDVNMAFKIAKTALDVWKKEVDLTDNAYEHFMITNGRGAGFHQFSGLSTPVLMWFRSLYTSGSITPGHFATITDVKFSKDKDKVSARIFKATKNGYAIICMSEKYDYKFFIDKKAVKAKKLTNGAYAVKIKEGKLTSEVV